MSEPLRIGFVGVGNMGQCAHLRNYVLLGDCRVVALAELREDVGRGVAQRYGIASVYADAARMLEDEKLDAIVASQPFTRHGVMLQQLAPTGLPIFIEKPLAASIEVGERILSLLAKTGAKVMVGYHKRSDPATIWAKERIDALKAGGELGAMRYVRITMPPGEWTFGGFAELIRSDGASPPPQLESDPPPSDMDEATRKKHVGFVNYYIHQINLMRHLLGEGYEVTHADPSGVLLVGRSASGVACTIEMATYHTTVDWQESAMVCFDKGYIKLEVPAPLVLNRAGTVEMLSDPGNRQTPQVTRPHLPAVHAMKQQAANFIRFARGEAPPPCDAAEALEDLKVARQYIRMLCGR